MTNIEAIREVLRRVQAPITLPAIQTRLAVDGHLVALDILVVDLDDMASAGELVREDLPGNRVTYCGATDIKPAAFFDADSRLAPQGATVRPVDQSLPPPDRILAALASGAMRANQLERTAGMSSPTCYRHMKTLINRGLVLRNGFHYSLAKTKGAACAAFNLNTGVSS